MDKSKILEVQLTTRERLYVKVYHDFLDCTLLNSDEKMLFIALKRSIDFRIDPNEKTCEVYPTMKTLCKITGKTRPTITKIIKSLQKKGIIKVTRRGLSKPNLYSISDNAEMWKAETIEELKEIANETELEKSIRIVESYGYVVKEKGLEATVPAKVTANSSAKVNNIIKDKDTTTETKSQAERYTLTQIRQLFGYDVMIHDQEPYYREQIDSVIDILHTAMNTTKPTIRVAGEDKPTMVVIGKLMKLDYETIMYAIEKFSEQTERIKNPVSYMLTILYTAPEQYKLDIQNQVKYDMSHWNEQE